MTDVHRMTVEQEAFAAHADSAFVHACPGAGKTQTIIARIARISATLPPRRGVAVLSFTNSSVDEFRERCRAAALDSLLDYPGFMGTLDSFVRHFIVLPGCPETCAKRPIILDSWNSLGIEIRLSGEQAFAGDPVSLDLFDAETNVIDPTKIGHVGLRSHVLQHKEKYEQAAANRRRGLLRAGYLSASDARFRTSLLIQDPVNGPALGRALAARFSEVIVDEGQDCNPLDLKVLSWLRQYGVRVTFVCDPDQAIYEFRNGGNPEDIRLLKESYPVDSQLELTGNFRSSPTVCRLAATLKKLGREDESVGMTANVKHPILLLGYGGRGPSSEIGRAFLDRVCELGLNSTKAIVLAHSGNVAQRASGGVAFSDVNGTSRIESLARSVAEFFSPAATSRSREMVVQAVEILLLEAMGLRLEGEHLLRTFERTGGDRRAHRRRALSFLMSLPKACSNTDADRLAWIATVRAQAELLDLRLPTGVTIRGFFRQPPNGKWSSHLQMPVQLGLTSATIHEAKGREYDAVCVVIPPNRAPKNHSAALFESWEERIEAEAKRVIYVGVTRTRYMAALAVPKTLVERCAVLLRDRQVTFTRRDL